MLRRAVSENSKVFTWFLIVSVAILPRRSDNTVMSKEPGGGGGGGH